MELSKNHNIAVFDSFLKTHKQWLDWLTEFNLTKLTDVPSYGGWSIGQLYLHLINETSWYLEQAALCLGNEDHINDSMTESAKNMFENNSFPQIKIKGDPLINDSIPQPSSKESLIESFMELSAKANAIWSEYLLSEVYGKTQHPGLNYFNPEEWFQYADMDIRHHIKQKEFILKELRY